MYRLGGASHPLKKKALENRYRVEIHVHSPIFQGQLIEKKIRSITFLVWVLGKVKKMPNDPPPACLGLKGTVHAISIASISQILRGTI